MKDDLKSLIDQDKEDNAVTAIYLACFVLLVVVSSFGAFLWFLFNKIFL